MSNKLYIVWCDDNGYATIRFISSSYNSAFDHAIDCIRKCVDDEYDHMTKAYKRNCAELNSVTRQLEVLRTIPHDDAIEELIYTLKGKQANLTQYIQYYQNNNYLQHDTEYYKKNFARFCNEYKVAITVAYTDAKMNFCADSYDEHALYLPD